MEVNKKLEKTDPGKNFNKPSETKGQAKAVFVSMCGSAVQLFRSALSMQHPKGRSIAAFVGMFISR